MDTDLRYQFSRSMTVTTRRWAAFLDKKLGELGLTGSRWYALVELSKSVDNPNQRELAARLHLEPASLVRILDRLSDTGLINRLPHGTDRRTKQVEITEKGEMTLKEISAISARVRETLLEGIDEADLATCLEVFRRIDERLAQTVA